MERFITLPSGEIKDLSNGRKYDLVTLEIESEVQKAVGAFVVTVFFLYGRVREFRTESQITAQYHRSFAHLALDYDFDPVYVSPNGGLIVPRVIAAKPNDPDHPGIIECFDDTRYEATI